ncbi:hypothetical protein ACO0LG_07205 [Undibacterium sp. Ji42W]|uniref:hypothetical protein n=1 Tax=Undibacterium sp. Ji42W TaxID=3413039 RepID=UPI003BF2986E
MIHVAIVSHGHEDLLIASGMGGLRDAAANMHVWIKDNQPSPALKAYCLQHGVSYVDDKPGLGFGENNNYLFDLISSSIGFAEGDSFIVMNPDITISANTIVTLVENMQRDAFPVATINLYRDDQHLFVDANVRRFPNIISLLRMVAVRSLSEPYDKKTMTETCHVDWASGAFLAFDAPHYRALQGFDTRYFMYFEDVDICYRSKQLLGKGIRFYPQLDATHTAAHKNRNLVSRHASWFFRSFLKFLSRRYFVYDRRSNLPAAK